MKKLLLIFALALAYTCSAFSQESEQPAAKNGVGVRLGFLANAQPSVGEMSEYVTLNIGAGFSAEIDLPVKLPAGIQLGIPASIYANFSISNTDMISSMWNLQPSTGIYARIKFLNNQLIIQPQIDYGASLNFLTVNDYYSKYIKNFYLDQMLQFALNIRYASEKIMDGNLEFSLTPYYMLSPEQNEFVTYAGVRLGIFLTLK